jgi:hypothetical protein
LITVVITVLIEVDKKEKVNEKFNCKNLYIKIARSIFIKISPKS